MCLSCHGSEMLCVLSLSTMHDTMEENFNKSRILKEYLDFTQ